MPIDLKPLPMAEALEYWRSKVQLTPKEFYALADIYKARAFTVSRLARADMLAEIHASLETALAEGTSFSAWKKSLSHVWEENGWTGVQAWRVDTIFRTNIQTAYNVGRYKQMMEVAADRPYWQYSAVNDSRTRPTHRALHGRVYRADSPFWDTFYPPNGHRCRCKVKTLSARQVAQRGLEVREGNGLGELIEPIGPHGPEPARPLMPDKGFEGNPGKEAWEPDLSKYPDWLRAKLEAALGADLPATTQLPDPPAGWGAYAVAENKADALAWAKTHYADEVDLSGLPLDAVNEINAAANETLVRFGVRLARLGKTPPRGALGYAQRRPDGGLTVDVSAPFAKDATAYAAKDQEAFVRQKSEKVRAAQSGLAQAPPESPLAMAFRATIQDWEGSARWIASSESSRPLFSAMAHECGHILDFATNKTARDAFSRELTRNGVARADRVGVSRYGAGKDSELFAEVCALWAEGRAGEVQDGIWSAFEAAIKTIKGRS